MSTMIVEVYDALKEAGASDEKAKAAAGALAEYGSRFDRVDSDLAIIKTEVAVVKAELAMVKWTMGVVLAGIVALVLKAFWPPV